MPGPGSPAPHAPRGSARATRPRGGSLLFKFQKRASKNRSARAQHSFGNDINTSLVPGESLPADYVAAMKLISINVAEPKIVFTHGRRVETGIFKKPVAGPVGVRFLNLDGDRQADLKVHGGPNKAVYAYSRENIDYWRVRLGRDDLVPGTFGENLTVEELLETEVAIGDEFEIGTARFQVSQPRLPCFKLGIVMGQPDFIKIFQRSGRTGFYLRVLREGFIRAGDEIGRFPTIDAEPIMVAEMVRIISARKLKPADAQRALKLGALSDGWKRQISEKLAKYGLTLR